MGRREAKLVVRRFFGGTTCHGLQQIESGVGTRATLWMAAVFFTCALCTYQFVTLGLHVRLYEVTIVPEISDDPIPFPAITMCNLNPYKTSKLGQIPQLKALEKLTSSLTGGGLKELGRSTAQRSKRSVRVKRNTRPPIAVYVKCIEEEFGTSRNSSSGDCLVERATGECEGLGGVVSGEVALVEGKVVCEFSAPDPASRRDPAVAAQDCLGDAASTNANATLSASGYHCYRSFVGRSLEKVGRDEALVRCFEEGGRLAALSDPADFPRVAAVMHGTYAWIGLYQEEGAAEPGGGWVWRLDDGRFVKVPNDSDVWNTGQPDDKNQNQHFGRFLKGHLKVIDIHETAATDTTLCEFRVASSLSHSTAGCPYDVYAGVDRGGQAHGVYPGVTGEECTDLCDALISCAGAVRGQVSGKCYLKKTNDWLSMTTAANLTVYVRRDSSCKAPSVGNCDFELKTLTPSGGRIGNPLFAGSGERCKAMCAALGRCIGVSFGDNGGNCTLYDSSMAPISSSSDEYWAKNSSGCTTTASSSTTTTAVEGTTSNSLTTPGPSEVMSPVGCAYSAFPGEGETVDGGRLSSFVAVPSAADCLALCDPLPSCTAAVFRQGHKCTLKDGEPSPLQPDNVADKVFYRRSNTSCQDEAVPLCEFTEMPGQKDASGTQKLSEIEFTVSSLDQCATLCAKHQTCAGVEFKTSMMCQLLRAANVTSGNPGTSVWAKVGPAGCPTGPLWTTSTLATTRDSAHTTSAPFEVASPKGCPYSAFPGQSADGGDLSFFEGVPTVDHCLARCDVEPSCVAAVFGVEKFCYLKSDEPNPLRPDATGKTFYRRSDQSCPLPTTTAASSTSALLTSTSLATATVASTTTSVSTTSTAKQTTTEIIPTTTTSTSTSTVSTTKLTTSSSTSSAAKTSTASTTTTSTAAHTTSTTLQTTSAAETTTANLTTTLAATSSTTTTTQAITTTLEPTTSVTTSSTMTSTEAKTSSTTTSTISTTKTVAPTSTTTSTTTAKASTSTATSTSTEVMTSSQGRTTSKAATTTLTTTSTTKEATTTQGLTTSSSTSTTTTRFSTISTATTSSTAIASTTTTRHELDTTTRSSSMRQTSTSPQSSTDFETTREPSPSTVYTTPHKLTTAETTMAGPTTRLTTERKTTTTTEATTTAQPSTTSTVAPSTTKAQSSTTSTVEPSTMETTTHLTTTEGKTSTARPTTTVLAESTTSAEATTEVPTVAEEDATSELEDIVAGIIEDQVQEAIQSAIEDALADSVAQGLPGFGGSGLSGDEGFAVPGQEAVTAAPLPPPEPDQSAIVTTLKDSLPLLVAQMTEEQLAAVSMTAEETFTLCSYDGEACEISKLKRVVDKRFGSCFVFNWEGSRNITRASKDHGFFVQMTVQKAEYMSLTESTGMRVAFHEPGVVAVPYTQGFNVATGYRSSFQLTYSQVIHLGEPYSACVREANRSTFLFEGGYSLDGCLESCMQAAVAEQCNCEDPTKPHLLHPEGLQRCDLEKKKCLDGFLASERSLVNVHCDKCSDPCEYALYQRSMTQNVWPQANEKVAQCSEEVIRYGLKSQEYLDCLELAREETVTMEVKLNKLSHIKYRETPKIDSSDIYSSVGGNLGIALGMSFLTIVEIILFVVQFFVALIK